MEFLQEDITRNVIKIDGNTTIYMEGYILDLFSVKHFEKPYKEVPRDVNSLIRKMAKDSNTENTAQIRKMVIADVVRPEVLKKLRTLKRQ